MRAAIVVALTLATASCSVRTPITFQNPFGSEPPLGVFDPLALGPLLVWGYADAALVQRCPDPSNPGLNPGCEVARFMVYDGSTWFDAGLVPCGDPTCAAEQYEFRLQDTYVQLKTKVIACNDLGTATGVWDSADGCSVEGATLIMIAPPTNPRFIP